ncbi:Cysteine protease atg4 [Puccinia graminis f. sp. tritici]|uniref:Cysteine protease n=1 Tax=Puccinia graminis f. sp. tritici TaxID=56615 RepID=A0A5B0M281_PUCGR|nr:Cysteine protease atg4 [Puccinia graminis f. sp. tritici]
MVTINSLEVELLMVNPSYHPLFTNQRAFMMTTNGTINVKLLGTSSSQDRSRTGSSPFKPSPEKHKHDLQPDLLLINLRRSLTEHSSSTSMNLRREQLDDFYAGAYPSSALQTFHPEKFQRRKLIALDPSMLLGFLVKDEADWEDLTAWIQPFKPPLFHIAEAMPWMCTNIDSTTSQTSANFRPSDDSDLGIDS